MLFLYESIINSRSSTFRSILRDLQTSDVFFSFCRRCDTGEGIFVFKTKDGGTIHKIVQKYAEDLATLMRNNSITDSILGAVNEDDTSVQLRPLPPIPAEQ